MGKKGRSPECGARGSSFRERASTHVKYVCVKDCWEVFSPMAENSTSPECSGAERLPYSKSCIRESTTSRRGHRQIGNGRGGDARRKPDPENPIDLGRYEALFLGGDGAKGLRSLGTPPGELQSTLHPQSQEKVQEEKKIVKSCTGPKHGRHEK